jgi:hypothetical protein
MASHVVLLFFIPLQTDLLGGISFILVLTQIIPIKHLIDPRFWDL